MPKPGKPIPDGYHTLTPYLCFTDTRKAIAFYQSAFGATEIMVMPDPKGKVMHAEMQFGNSRLMLGDEVPQMNAFSADHYKGSPASLMVYVDDVDAAFGKAVKAGAKVIMPPMDMFWGDRMAKLADPFGYEWAIATHKLDLSPEEMKDAACKAMSQSPA